MLKNKNGILIVAFILLGSLSFYLLKYKDQKTNKSSWERDFAVKNVEDITKIFLGKKDNENITLTKNGLHWMVNDKYKVFPNTMMHLLEIIKSIRVNSIPHRNAYSFIMNEFATKGIKVEIYSDKEKLKTYYVGGVTEDETGLYCLMDGSDQPYIMTDGKAPSNLRVRYDIKEKDWRDRSLFNLNPDRVTELVLDYPREPNRGFKIVNKNGKLDLEDMTGHSIDLKDLKFLQNYISQLPLFMAEAITNDLHAKDSISKLIPYLSYKINTSDSPAPIELKLYPVNENTDTPIDLSDEFLKLNNFFRFYILRSDGDVLLIQKHQINNIFIDLPTIKSLYLH
ncbi:MAG: DUF4340 domain-containing protein [Saprospiraceae bacterium]|nr:DUF4340 domain-containing protein [Saprospiraceae bacterium]